MNVGIFVNTPAQVHFYKNIAKSLEKKKNKVYFLARDYRETLAVLDGLGIKYFIYSKPHENKITKITDLPITVLRAQNHLKNIGVDITLGFGGPEAYTAFLLNKPSVVFQDSEPHINMSFLIQFKLFIPFVSTIITPNIFSDNLGEKHIKINSFKEMAYLHPSYFHPDVSIFDLLKIEKNEPFLVLRFNALDAVHDAGIGGFSLKDKRKLIQELKKYARVFISAEGDIPKDFEKYVLKIPKQRIHDCLYYAKMIIADTQTMVTEAGILGTPAIRCNSFIGKNDMGNFIELEEKYKLIFNYKDPNRAIEKAVELIQNPDLKNKWKKRKQRLLDDKINLTSFMVWFIENFPDSFKEIKENPDLQYRFK